LVGPSTAPGPAISTGVSPALAPTPTLIGTVNYAIGTAAATVIETFLPGTVGPSVPVPIPPGHEIVLHYTTPDGGGTLGNISFTWNGQTP